MAFTTHILVVPIGEDIIRKIISFCLRSQSPMGRGVCVLSAVGYVSTVMVSQPSTGGIVAYQGFFQLLSLNGSFMPVPADNFAYPSFSGGLSVSVARPDSYVVAGEVAGVLIAATEVQVTVFSFIPGEQKSELAIKRNGKRDANGKKQLPKGSGKKQLTKGTSSGVDAI